mgnify:CR=1 FL=1
MLSKKGMRESKEYLRQKANLLGAENEVLKDENAALREMLIYFAPFLMNYPLAGTRYTAPMDTGNSTNSILSSSSFDDSLGSQQISSSSSESSICMTAGRNNVWVGGFQYGARGSGEDASGAPESRSDDYMAPEIPSIEDDFWMQFDLPMDGAKGWGNVTFTPIAYDNINPALAESLSDVEESEGGNTKRCRYNKPATEKGKEIEVGSDDEGYD